MVVELALQKVEKVAKDFDLRFDRSSIGLLVLPPRKLIILHYLLSPFFTKFGKDKKTKFENLVNFLKSSEYKKELRKYPYIGGTLNYSSIEKTKNYLQQLNLKIPKRKIICYSSRRQDVIVHELLHALLDINNLRMKKWQNTEALVVYMEHRALGRLKKLDRAETMSSIKNRSIRLSKFLENKTITERKIFIRRLASSTLHI